LRTPTGIDGTVGIDYREGTGSYSHAAIDSWRCSMIFGGLKITDPISGGPKVIPAAGNVLGLMSKKDNTNKEWFSAAGAKRGRIGNTTGVEYNLGSPARALEFDSVVNHGINAVIDDAQFGTVYWGNKTLSKGGTLLQYENIAELFVYLERTLSPAIRVELFDPNDVITWKNIFRRVYPIMEQVKAERGCYDYKYEGDQNVDTIEEAVINTLADVQAGKYTFYLWVKPINATMYVGIKVVVTDLGVSFDLAPADLGI
jgi:phage tail sheath protein FI